MILLYRCITFGVCNFWLAIGATTYIGLKILRDVDKEDELVWKKTKANYVECMKMIFSR